MIVATAEWWSTRVLRDHGDCGLRSFVVVVTEQCGGRAARDEGRGLRVVGSSPTSGFEVGVAARSGQVPQPGLTEIDPWGPVLLGVCVCPWAPSVK